MQTVNEALSASKIPVFEFTVCTSWFAHPWTDDLSHSCPHRYFTPNFTFAFAFVILKVTNSEMILFRFALISVSMVCLVCSLAEVCRNPIQDRVFAWGGGGEEDQLGNKLSCVVRHYISGCDIR